MFKSLADKKYNSLFEVARAEQVQQDLNSFFGPRAAAYQKVYERMRAKRDSGRWFVMSWSWPVFFLSFVWFFYRKLFLIGAIMIVLPIVIGLLFPSAQVASIAGFAVLAKPIYVQFGLNRILKADALNLTGAERAEYLQKAGGVSWPAGILAGILYAALFALAIYAALAELPASP